ncbi:non-receptor serine/threonine protein kinase [Lithospermum erythrorhizon]|uniref:Non-receptor serine/threonine protein kinase n=1 Tax=Lithospermum erythrorhizon TaxID=34254 RepID=A0AAV3QLK3_LITER
MGSCFSSSKVVSGSSSNTPSTTMTNKPHTTVIKPENDKKNGKKCQQKQQIKGTSKQPNGGVIPCGKRTDFGYDKDFKEKYSIGKLLGHGQFGYTYVATDKFNGDRVAVKKIDKNKVILVLLLYLCGIYFIWR